MLVLLVLVSILIVQASNHLNISTFIGSYENELYLLHHGVRRALPVNDNETIQHLGFNPTQFKHLPIHHFLGFAVGEPVPPIHQKDSSTDEIMRVALEANHILQPRLFKELFHVGNYINPSLVLFKGRFLMATGLAWSVNGVNEGKAPTEHMEFKWYNHSLYPFFSDSPYIGVGARINALEHRPLLGQDPRMLRVNDDKIIICYTNRFETPRTRMGIAEIIYNATTDRLEAGQVYVTIFWNSKQPEKNWSPFLHNGSNVFLIQNINPFHIVGYAQVPGEKSWAISASQAPPAHIPYRHGHLRGGTNAVDIGDRYLAFFHSNFHFGGQEAVTYLMGAYTFTKDSPWRLLQMSPQPLMDDKFYTGAWSPFKNRHIDFVVFPNSLFQEGEDVYVGFGVQDYQGWLARINLQELLTSLEPVIYCDEDKYPELRKHYCSDDPKSTAASGGKRKKNRR